MDSCHNISAAEDIEMLDMDERLRQVVVRGAALCEFVAQALVLLLLQERPRLSLIHI